MEKSLIKTTGIVKEILEDRWYLAELKGNGILMKVHLSQKATWNLEYDIFIGEEVPIEYLQSDLTRGRIRTRYWIRPKKS